MSKSDRMERYLMGGVDDLLTPERPRGPFSPYAPLFRVFQEVEGSIRVLGAL